MTLPNEDLRRIDTAHHLHPFTDHKALAGEGGARVITRGEGVWIYDSEGRSYIDAMAGLWCVNIGYGRKELVEAARRQMSELAYYNTFFKSTTPAATALAEKVSGLLPREFNRLFFVNSGSEANDTVVRLIRHYWNLRGKPDRKIFISRKNGYHGSTMVAASLGGMTPMHEQGDLPLPGFVHIDQPYWYGEGGDMEPEAFGKKAAKALEDKIRELGPDHVAAFVAEPVQGAGGVIIPPDSYWPEINRICDKYGILVVCDEVICGFGRTGNWFGHQTYDIRADVIPVAKGLSSGYLPIGAVAVSDTIADFLIKKGGEFTHGFTYSGHPVACAVALENIKIMEEENLIEQVATTAAPKFATALARLADHPLVGEVRTVGLLGAIELVEDKASRRRFDPLGDVGTQCRDHCVDSGIVMRACGDTMVLSPPLVISDQEIDEMVKRARTALDLTEAAISRA